MAILTNRRHKRSEDKRGARSGTGMSWLPPYWVIMVAGSLPQYPECVQVALSCFCWLLPDFVLSSLNSAIANPGAPWSCTCFPKSYLQLCKLCLSEYLLKFPRWVCRLCLSGPYLIHKGNTRPSSLVWKLYGRLNVCFPTMGKMHINQFNEYRIKDKGRFSMNRFSFSQFNRHNWYSLREETQLLNERKSMSYCKLHMN